MTRRVKLLEADQQHSESIYVSQNSWTQMKTTLQAWERLPEQLQQGLSNATLECRVKSLEGKLRVIDIPPPHLLPYLLPTLKSQRQPSGGESKAQSRKGERTPPTDASPLPHRVLPVDQARAERGCLALNVGLVWIQWMESVTDVRQFLSLKTSGFFYTQKE